MAIDLERFNQLVRDRDKCQRDSERAAGACETIIARLRKEFGCESFEEGDSLEKKSEREADRLEEEYDAEWERAEELSHEGDAD